MSCKAFLPRHVFWTYLTSFLPCLTKNDLALSQGIPSRMVFWFFHIAFRFSHIVFWFSHIAFWFSHIAFWFSHIAFWFSYIAFWFSYIAFWFSPIAFWLSQIAFWFSHIAYCLLEFKIFVRSSKAKKINNLIWKQFLTFKHISLSTVELIKRLLVKKHTDKCLIGVYCFYYLNEYF